MTSVPHVECAATDLAWPGQVQLQGTQAHVTPCVHTEGQATRSELRQLNLNQVPHHP